MTTFKGVLTELKFHPATMAVRKLRKSLADIYPSIAFSLSPKACEAVIADFSHCRTISECIAFTQRHMGGGACQIPTEIDYAIRLMNKLGPKIVCEIGTYQGGTSLLLSRFVENIEAFLCVDIYVKNKHFLRLLSPPGLKLHFFDMPSYAARTVREVKRVLNGRKIDVLFIDGDHRYEGVRNDFLHYRSLVSDGGLIFFHDIVEARGSGRTWVGGVPRLWKELRPRYPHHEFIDDPGQEGFGIGALTYSNAITPPD